MSLNKGNNQEQNSTAATKPAATVTPKAAQAAQQQNVPQTTQTPPQKVTSMQLNLSGLGRNLQVGFSRVSSSETLVAVQKGLQLALDATNPNVKVMFVPLDVGSIPQMGISALALVSIYDGVPFYYLMLLAKTASPQKVRSEYFNGQQFEHINVPGVYNNPFLQQQVADEISRVVPNGDKALQAGVTVVQKEFDITSEQAFKRLLVNGLFANDNEYRSSSNSASVQDLDLSKVGNSNSLTSTVSFGNEDVVGVDGSMMASDVIVSVAQQEKGPAAGQIPVVVPLTQLHAYLDVVVGANPQQQQNPLAAFALPSITYIPNLVITDAYAMEITTASSTLLAIMSALAVVKDYGWVRGFKPRNMGFGGKAKAAQDLNDVGAIGYEVNQLPDGKFEAYSTKGADFDDQQLLRLMAAHFQPSPMISIDVPLCGPSTYVLSSLVMAANGVDAAKKFWIQAADTLTGNKFSAIWKNVDNGQAPIAFLTNRVFLGHYSDAEGVKDLRHITHIAFLNLTQDGKLGELFMGTNQLTNEPIFSRLARRKKLLQRVLNDDNVVINDFADRVTFNVEFLRCLSQAVEACGITINPENTTSDLTMQSRGVASYAQGAMLNGQFGVFRDNYSTQGYGTGMGDGYGGVGYGGNQNSRW
jgi:hypothetical protein